jgi:heme/copper-type cytochrome/quinol oxidase subunit 2
MTNVKGDSTVEEIKIPLDSDSLLTLTYWFFVMIACFITFGLGWDYWVYKKRSQAQHDDPEQHGNVFGYTVPAHILVKFMAVLYCHCMTDRH